MPIFRVFNNFSFTQKNFLNAELNTNVKFLLFLFLYVTREKRDPKRTWLPNSITKLENRGFSLNEAVEEIDRVNGIPGAAGEMVIEKLKFVLSKNIGFSKLKEVNFINGEVVELSVEVPDTKAKYYEYCSITSVDVERTFSAIKMVLNDRRQSLTVSNIEKHIVIYCNRN